MAKSRYNVVSGRYELAGEDWELRYNPVTGETKYTPADAELKYNVPAGRTELAQKDSKLAYNVLENEHKLVGEDWTLQYDVASGRHDFGPVSDASGSASPQDDGVGSGQTAIGRASGSPFRSPFSDADVSNMAAALGVNTAAMSYEGGPISGHCGGLGESRGSCNRKRHEQAQRKKHGAVLQAFERRRGS
jgi:hypothetical protein